MTLEEQISRKCIHFNGVMSKFCEKGISYADVRVDKPYKFPCLKQGGKCDHAQFRTEEEVRAEIADIQHEGIKVLKAVALVKYHYEKTKQQSGTIVCQCGGELKYVVAETNGHVWVKCKSCGIYFNE